MSSQAETSWCRITAGDTSEGTFRFTIDNFKNRPEKIKECLKSTSFKVNGPGDLETKWKLEIYPKGKTNEDDIALYLKNKSKVKVKAKYKVDIIDSSGNERESSQSKARDYETHGMGSSWGKNIWLKRERLNDDPDLLPDGNLTIQCKVTVFGPEKILSGSDISANSSLFVHCQKQLGEHLGKIFSDKQFTDVKIQCEGQSFDCHMAILAARSPVFMAMFQSDMMEKETQSVTIDDFKAGVVGEMLNFIYRGNVSSHDAILEHASELLEAADKYQLDLLKDICEESLCTTLKVNNCVEYLVLGDMHHTLKLKNSALRLVVENSDCIIETDVFKEFLKKKPELVLEVMKALNKK